MQARTWLAAVVVLGSVVWAGSDTVWAGCSACGKVGMAAYGAMPCAAPGYGAMMVPGCCECPPTCCDHVWDGYCQEKGCHKRLGCKARPVPACVGCQPMSCQPEMVFPAPGPVGPAILEAPQPAPAPSVMVDEPAPKAAPTAPAKPTAKDKKK